MATPDRVLLYTSLDNDVLLFLPKPLALSMRAARRNVEDCRLGNARERLSPDWYEDLQNTFAGSDDTLDGASIAAEWPSVRYSSVTDHLPRDVVAELGETYSGLFEDGVTFSCDQLEDIEEALARHGI